MGVWIGKEDKTVKVVSSYQIKAALMYYYRWKRNMICAPELHCGDIIVWDGAHTHEIEIKISKSDLWNGEAKKDKHIPYLRGHYVNYKTMGIPNKFSVCVPSKLLETTKEWVQKTNKKYGIIVCQDAEWMTEAITICKTAKNLHTDRDNRFTYSLLRKLSSIAVESYMQYWKNPEKVAVELTIQ